MRYPILLIALASCTNSPSEPSDDRPSPPTPTAVDTSATAQPPDSAGPPASVWTVTSRTYSAGRDGGAFNSCTQEGIYIPSLTVVEIDSIGPSHRSYYILYGTGMASPSDREYDYRRQEASLSDSLTIDETLTAKDGQAGTSSHSREFDPNPYDNTEPTITSECF